MPTAEQATATLHLAQADIESLVSFKSIAAKKATKYGSDELTKVRLTVLTDRWEVRAHRQLHRRPLRQRPPSRPSA